MGWCEMRLSYLPSYSILARKSTNMPISNGSAGSEMARPASRAFRLTDSGTVKAVNNNTLSKEKI